MRVTYITSPMTAAKKTQVRIALEELKQLENREENMVKMLVNLQVYKDKLAKDIKEAQKLFKKGLDRKLKFLSQEQNTIFLIYVNKPLAVKREYLLLTMTHSVERDLHREGSDDALAQPFSSLSLTEEGNSRNHAHFY